jgi:hypothetical protein
LLSACYETLTLKELNSHLGVLISNNEEGQYHAIFRKLFELCPTSEQLHCALDRFKNMLKNQKEKLANKLLKKLTIIAIEQKNINPLNCEDSAEENYYYRPTHNSDNSK